MSQKHRSCCATFLIKAGIGVICLISSCGLVSGLYGASNPKVPTTAVYNSGRRPASQPESGRFYATAKPYTRWWWFASLIKKDDIVRQLDWLKAHGFGGVEVAWVYPLNIERYKRFYTWITDEERKVVVPRQAWQSPEWSGIVAFAKDYAAKIGLGLDFTFGSAWPFGDSLVPAEDATKVYGNPEFKQEVIISWEYPKNGLVIDHLNKGAFERYAARMGAALSRATHTGGKSALFCDSWEVETKGIWTDGFGEAFKKRFGYEIEPYMAAILAPENAGPRYDYMKLVSEYVIENFYKPFTEKSHELGAFSRVQASGSPTDLITAYAAADVPETEALLYEPDYGRVASSAAALSGKKDVTCETFTCSYGYPREHFKEEQAADLKLIADAVLANGVNLIFWHGTPFNTRGAAHDNEFYASVHVGEKGTLAGELAEFNRYLEKVSAWMGAGRTFSSLAVYIPLEDAWVQGEYPKELQFGWTGTGAYELRYIKPAGETNGYHPLWINGEFLKRGRIEGGHLSVGDASFSSLYIDVGYLDGEALGTIIEIAKNGFPVCLKRRPAQPGRNQTARYREQLEELTRLPNVSSDLKALAIPKPLVEGDGLPDFWCRVKDGAYYIFFAHPLAQGLKLPLKYGQSFVEKEMTRRVTINANGASTTLDLIFKPHQSLLIKVDKNGQPSFIDIEYAPKTPLVRNERDTNLNSRQNFNANRDGQGCPIGANSGDSCQNARQNKKIIIQGAN
jgi:hypothetical protein